MFHHLLLFYYFLRLGWCCQVGWCLLRLTLRYGCCSPQWHGHRDIDGTAPHNRHFLSQDANLPFLLSLHQNCLRAERQTGLLANVPTVTRNIQRIYYGHSEIFPRHYLGNILSKSLVTRDTWLARLLPDGAQCVKTDKWHHSASPATA